jgi:hypothetical protein
MSAFATLRVNLHSQSNRDVQNQQAAVTRAC